MRKAQMNLQHQTFSGLGRRKTTLQCLEGAIRRMKVLGSHEMVAVNLVRLLKNDWIEAYLGPLRDTVGEWLGKRVNDDV